MNGGEGITVLDDKEGKSTRRDEKSMRRDEKNPQEGMTKTEVFVMWRCL